MLLTYVSRSLIIGSLILKIPFVLADSYAYQQNAVAGVDQLMKSYDQNTGLWQNGSEILWWNSANILTAIIDLAAVNITQKLQYGSIIARTFAAAPAANPQAQRRRSIDGPSPKEYIQQGARGTTRRTVKSPQHASFLNGFYDDEGWWALAWIDAYDLTSDIKYLLAAASIWRDMKGGETTNCGAGSIWWDKQHTSIASVSNELFFHLSASLTSRVALQDSVQYLTSALESWSWFKGSGVIGSDNLIVDGLDKNCKPTGTTFTYNQGVILGALIELSHATNDSSSPSYLDEATTLANASIRENSPLIKDGILHEPNWCDGTNMCGTFKGVFVRNLRKLHRARPSEAYKQFLQLNAQSIWTNNAKFEDGGVVMLGPIWAGPFEGSFNIPAHASALECLTAAFVVS